MKEKVVLITGAAKRVGAAIAKHLHGLGYNVVIHYNHSKIAAENLVQQFNRDRKNSAICIQANLLAMASIKPMVKRAMEYWGRLDILINNASMFYKTPIDSATEQQWFELINSNLTAPFFISQAVRKALIEMKGQIINIVDIHAQIPIRDYSIYCIAKSGLVTLTKSLAKEFAPKVRVNAIAPGTILWPEDKTEISKDVREKIVNKILLQREGHANDIAETVEFLIKQNFINGQVIAVDGGRSVNI